VDFLMAIQNDGSSGAVEIPEGPFCFSSGNAPNQW
jgi:hypothetical protein